MKSAGFVETWRDFGRGTKALFLTMMLLGVAVFAFGIYADFCHTEWLKAYSYLPNILAGFTGFLIGVPVALVGLSTITGQREEKAASDRVQALTRIAWDPFRDAVYDLCSVQRTEALAVGAQRIQIIHDQTFAGFKNYRAHPDRSVNSYLNMIDFMEHQKHVWTKAFEDMISQVGHSFSLQSKWYDTA